MNWGHLILENLLLSLPFAERPLTFRKIEGMFECQHFYVGWGWGAVGNFARRLISMKFCFY
jgi:hypothetical protein